MTTLARLRIAFIPRTDGLVRARSREFTGEVEFDIASPPPRSGDFGDYLRGCAVVLSEQFPLSIGCDALVEGDLMPGGVSSSAALACAWLAVLLDLHGLDLSRRDRIRVVVEAERRYAGVEVGILDPTVILSGGPRKIVYIDCLDGVPKAYPIGKKCPPFDALILDSGVDRDLRESPYNLRVEECRSAARALGATGDPPVLRSIGYEEFRRKRSGLDPTAAKRVDHVLSENKRVKHGLSCFAQGDLAGLGALMNQSGRSMVDFFGAGTPETTFLLDELQRDASVIGATLAGAGFGGGMLAFIQLGSAGELEKRIRPLYASKFPDAARRMTFTVVSLGGQSKIDIG